MVFKFLAWIAGSAFVSWVWYSLLSMQTLITGFGFSSLLALGVIAIFYFISEFLGLNLSQYT